MLNSRCVRYMLAVIGFVTVGSLVVVADQVAPMLGGGLEITRSTIDAGGGTISGGSFELSATIGQPEAGTISGGTIELAGGFWSVAGEKMPVCLADIAHGDGMVNIDDLVMVILAWGNPGGPADVNSSGTVDIDDLVIIIISWGMCP